MATHQLFGSSDRLVRSPTRPRIAIDVVRQLSEALLHDRLPRARVKNMERFGSPRVSTLMRPPVIGILREVSDTQTYDSRVILEETCHLLILGDHVECKTLSSWLVSAFARSD